MRKIMDSVCNFNQQSEVFPGLFLSCHMGNGPGSLRQSPGKTKNVLQGERERELEIRSSILILDLEEGKLLYSGKEEDKGFQLSALPK